MYMYMSELSLVHEILTSGLEGAGLIFLLVLSYKVYKMKIKTRSNCCADSLNIETSNDGGNLEDVPL